MIKIYEFSQKCCDILRISYEFNELELRTAYLEGCKRTHPDSQNEDNVNSIEEFMSIERAYNRLKHHLKAKELSQQIVDKLNSLEDEEEEKRLKHTVPQHRQYLTFDGIGYGSPSDRQKQYQKYRLSKATNRVNEFQLNKIQTNEELSEKNAILLKDSNLQREMKTRQGFDRLVEDLIQESMAKGDFDNLPGSGKPLKSRPEYPYLDSTTYKLNEILINNRFVPEWVLLEKEIREEKKLIENKIFSLKSQSKIG